MTSSIANTISQFLPETSNLLSEESLANRCKSFGLKWRNRLLPPAKTINLMLLQIINGNTAISHLPHLSNSNFSAPAFCKARAKLPTELLENLFDEVTSMFSTEQKLSNWCGHEVYLVDGSSFSMSDEKELKQFFGSPPKQAKGEMFPLSKTVFKTSLMSGMIVKCVNNSYSRHEHSTIREINSDLKPNDIIVGDRGFCSYEHLSLVLEQNAHAVFRVHKSKSVSFRKNRSFSMPGKPSKFKGQPKTKQIKVLAKRDQIVEYFKPAVKNRSMKRENFNSLPESIIVREIQFEIKRKGFRSKKVILVTTLLDEKKYSTEEIAKLYLRRWEIETNFAQIKGTMKMDILKTKSVEGVKKELISYCLAYNIVRFIMIKASEVKKTIVTKISFIDALRWIKNKREKKDIKFLQLIPKRPGRYEPRKKRRKPKPYPWLKQKRIIEKRKPLEKQKLTA